MRGLVCSIEEISEVSCWRYNTLWEGEDVITQKITYEECG
jgi:hypothetical protein